MAVQAFYRKWRPQTFDRIVGQTHVVRTLRNALVSGRIHHAYLFAGPRGTGKTTTARLLAKAVNCLASEEERPCNECAICKAVNDGRLIDLIEIDAASNTGVDDVRELRERVGFRPNEARYKVYVVDEVHMLSNAAFNALLKTLEEPPPHAIFVLATTEPHKIPATVLSRCQRFDFRRIPLEQIVDRLQWITNQEEIQADRDALMLVAQQATGSMRDAESLLDQLASYGDSGRITIAAVRAALGTGDWEAVREVTDALAAGEVAQGLSAINTAVDQGTDPRQFARQIVEYLRQLLLVRLDADVVRDRVSKDELGEMGSQAERFSPRALIRAVRAFNEAAVEAKGGWHPQLPLEMAFVEATLPAEAAPVERGQDPESSSPRSSSPRPKQRSSSPSSQSSLRPKRKAETPSPATSQANSASKTRESETGYAVAERSEEPLTPQKLRQRWSDFLNILRPQNLSLEALVRSSAPVRIEGDVIVLGFAHNFHRGKVEEDRNRCLVEDAFSDLLGRRYRVRCVLTKEEEHQVHQEAESSASSAEGNGSEQSKGSSVPSLEDDPLVRSAVEDLGAEIIGQ